MIIDKPGKYLLLREWSVRGGSFIKHFAAGQEILVTQIDRDGHQCIGPSFGDWAPWEIPAKPAEKEGA